MTPTPAAIKKAEAKAQKLLADVRARRIKEEKDVEAIFSDMYRLAEEIEKENPTEKLMRIHNQSGPGIERNFQNLLADLDKIDRQ